MTGCRTCGGYGMHHDPIAHDVTMTKPEDEIRDAYDRGYEAGYREGLDDAAAETGR